MASLQGARILSTLLFLIILAHSPVGAQPTPSDTLTHVPIEFNISVQPLGAALNAFAEATGWQVSVPSELVSGLTSSGISGKHMPEEALQALLIGTGLTYRITGTNAVTLVPGAIMPSSISPLLGKENATLPEPAGEPITTAQQKPIKVPEIMVKEVKERTYAVNDAYTATQSDAPIKETPVSIQVVPQKVLQDQQVVRVREAMKNVSGVQPGFGSGFGFVYDSFQIRGFHNVQKSFLLPQTYRNGNLMVGSVISLADVERIELLKGPAAVLYGRVEPGGMVNIVTKQPQKEAHYALQQQFGSYELFRTIGEATGPLTKDGSLLYRFDFEFADQKSFRDSLDNRLGFVSPKIRWKPAERTQIDFEYMYTNQRTRNDWGIPVIGNRVAGVPISRSFFEPDGSVRTQVHAGGLTVTQGLFDNWTVQGRIFKYVNYGRWIDVGNSFLDESTGDLHRFLSDTPYRYDSTVGSLKLSGAFATGPIAHRVAFGADYYHLTIKNDGVFLDDISTINIFNPVYGQGLVSSAGQPFNYFFKYSDDWYGMFAQDQVKIGEKFHLLAGVRYDNARTSTTFNEDRSSPTKTVNGQFSPRFGILYQPVSWLGLYASYTRGFNGENSGRLADGSQAVKPERSTQYEAGVKGSWLDDRLRATAAVYELTKENLATPHPDASLSALGVVELAGEARSRGVEFDIQGDLSKSWSVIGSYSYIDARITEDTLTKGNRLPNVPRNSGSFWVNHQFVELGLPNLGAGLGVYAMTDRQGDRDNTITLPGFARLDAALHYVHRMERSKVYFRLNVQNLLNQEYFMAARNRATVYPGEPITVLGQVRFEY